MSNKIKLYDASGKFQVTVPTPAKKFEGLQHYNNQGLYTRDQFNKSRTQVIRTYSGNAKVEPSVVIKSMERQVFEGLVETPQGAITRGHLGLSPDLVIYDDITERKA